MSSTAIKELMGSRILSEANDLKRTVTALAQEIEIDEQKLKDIVQGKCDLSETQDVIERMGRIYPINRSDLYLDEDDCVNGIRIITNDQSFASSRIFLRKNKDGERTEYYDYRDTAMSKLSPFKPEWIKELRVVDNNDPYNPDIAYNNGHFLHQMTFFIGPVNFYWEVNGKKYCQEMNTGDSNYITPFWPHSFASRDPNQEAIIIAVTFGGDVRRAQRECYMMGLDNIVNYKLDMDNHARATAQIITQHMKNEDKSVENLNDALKANGSSVDIQSVLDEKVKLSIEELKEVAVALNVDLTDILLSESVANQEVTVKVKDANEAYLFPNKDNPLYRINPLARCVRMSQLKGMDVEVNTNEFDFDNALESSLHSYVYNYGDSNIKFKWNYAGQEHEAVLRPGDSTYIKPFVKHAYANEAEAKGKLLVVRVSGAINISTQKELSYFADVSRVIESKCWFD